MMAKKKSKYPTSFDTYEEFEKVFDFIPAKDRYEWAENLDPNLLRIENEDGWTVAHELARKGTLPKKWITEELLRVEDNELGTTIAHELAYSGTLPEEFITDNLLRMKTDDGRTVAHTLAWNGTLPEKFVTDELLWMKTDYGWTVAHELAYWGTLPEKFVTDELLRMKTDNGRAVAHVLAKSGTLPEKFITEELLRMEDKDGWTVAHMLAHNRILPEKWITEDLLRTKMDNGWTVAHELVYNGTFPMEHLLSPDKRVSDELLRMKEYNFGWTVAHLLAKLGVFPEERITEDLLREKDRDGDTVAGYYYDYMYENNRWNLLTPAVLNAPYMGKTSVIAKLKKDLTKMSDSKLGSALVLMQRKTLLYLRSKVRNISLRDAIQKCLDRETDNEAFETSPDGNDTDLHTHGQEELYGAERGM